MSTFRADIEGLRAIAVVAVLLYHAGMPAAGGGYVGVDVFFVISGFLITGLLLREAETSGTISLRRFYAKRVRRLLPASILALAATALMTVTVLPSVRWSSIAGDVMASAAYVVNWRFAGRAVDYLAEGAAASPVQHFWSLAVEEQFYLFWPLLILIAGSLFAAKFSRRAVAITLLVVTLVSLGWSVLLTNASANEAYFVTTTRVWELGLGAGIALAAPLVSRMPRAAAEILTWVGLVAIGIAAMTYGPGTPFPSYTALLPTLGAALVIGAGVAHADTSGARLLSLRPMVWIGGISYSLYLYHWPMIVGAESVYGSELPPSLGFAVVSLAILPAWLSFKYVEDPIRHASSLITPPRRAMVFGVALTLSGLFLGAGILGVTRIAASDASSDSVEAIERSFDTSNPQGSTDDQEDAVTGSRVDPSMVPETVPDTLNPSLTRVVDDVPTVYEDGCHVRISDSDPRSCVFGVSGGQEVALVGDSHAAQWAPTLERIADEQGWRLTTLTKSACPVGLMTASRDGEIYAPCIDWNERVLQVLIDTRPDLVLISSSTSNLPVNPDGSVPSEVRRAEMFVEGLTKSVGALTAESIPVVLIADTPRPLMDIPECISGTSVVAECTVSLDAARPPDFHRRVAQSIEGAALADLTPWICTDSGCPPIIEDVIVWRDTHHLTATYARLLSGPLLDLLRVSEEVSVDTRK